MSELETLIIRKQQLDDDTLGSHAGQVADALELDAYQSRIALGGDGLAVLKRGKSSDLLNAGTLLFDLGYDWFVIKNRVDRLRPINVKRFSATESGIVFEGVKEKRRLEKGTNIIAVLAGVKGQLLSKVVKRSAFSGNKKASLSEEEKYSALIKDRPVLDLYFLPSNKDETFTPQPPLRIIPGKFNPSSLGEHATHSAGQNIDRVVRLVRKYAGDFHLEMDFGLFQLPQCRVELNDDEASIRHNLESITNYGWFLQHLHIQGNKVQKQKTKPPIEQAIGAVTAAISPAIKQGIAPVEELFTKKEEKAENRQIQDKDFLPSPPLVEKSSSFFRISNPGFRAGIFLAIWFLAVSGAATVGSLIGGVFITWGINRGIIVLLLSAGLFIGAFHYLRIKRWMDNTPTSKARSVAMGMVEIKGTGQRKYNLMSPATQTPCIYYRLRKYELRQYHDRRQWKLVRDTNSGPVPFLLKDETGCVTVDPDRAKVNPAHKQTLAAGYNSFLGMSFTVHSNEKYIEEIIPEGATVYVLGFAEYQKSEGPGIAREMSAKLRDLKQDSARMMKYDTNADGRVDEEEWETARADAELDVMRDTLDKQQTAKKQEDLVIIKKPKFGGLPFVISENSETKLTGIYMLLTGSMFAGAIITVLFGMAMLLGLLSIDVTTW